MSRKKRRELNKIRTPKKVLGIKHLIKIIKGKQLGNMKVIAELVKEVETLIFDSNNFSKNDNS